MSKNKKMVDAFTAILRSDGGLYISVLIFSGYLFTAIQQIVRYSYYGVELTYMLSIKLEDILLGAIYIFILFTLVLTIFKTCKERKLLWIIDQILLLFLMSAFACALSLRTALDLRLFFSIAMISANIIVNLVLWCAVQLKNRSSIIKKVLCYLQYKISTTSRLCKITAVILTAVLVVAVLQFSFESYNKRFTYIQQDDGMHGILTTFQDNFITVAAKADGDTITIYRGNVKLIPMAGSVIRQKQFEIKHLA